MAKSKAKRTALEVQLYKHIQQSYKFQYGEHIVHQVLFIETIPVPDRIGSDLSADALTAIHHVWNIQGHSIASIQSKFELAQQI